MTQPASSSSSRPRIHDSASIPDSSAFGTTGIAPTGIAPIDLGTETGVPFELPALPISFISWNTSRSQWPTSQTCVASAELPIDETSLSQVISDPRDEPRQPPKPTSSHWFPQVPPARTQQTALEQTHISPTRSQWSWRRTSTPLGITEFISS